MNDPQRRGDVAIDRLDARLAQRGQRLDGEAQPALPFLAGKIRRHWQWARSGGFLRLVEEDQLNLLDRRALARRKRRWLAVHGCPPGSARPVFVVGVQRSGTNMVLRGLDRAPELEVHGENDRRAFSRYQLRDDVDEVIDASRSPLVLFKPLCDSHRVDELLDRHASRQAAALWVYRDVAGRSGSTVAKFGDHERTVLEAIAANVGGRLWQAQRLSPETVATIRSLDPSTLSPASAAALFWWARNSLFFDLHLDERRDVLAVSYEAFMVDADREMRRICAFIGLPFRADLVAHVGSRGRTAQSSIGIDDRVRALCDELARRFGPCLARPRPAAPSRVDDHG